MEIEGPDLVLQKANAYLGLFRPGECGETGQTPHSTVD